MSASTSIGPISGIDYGKLITGLIGIEQQPIDDITTRLGTLDKQNTALLGLSTLMTGLKISAANFTSSAVFRAATATPGNPSILSATAGLGTAVGNYNFNVQRLASASQQVSQGFSDSTSALGLSGTVKLQLGGGRLDATQALTALNGGSGVARGSIRISDGSGATTLINLSQAVDVNDVVNTINSTTGVNVVAKLDNDRLVLTDNSGGAGALTVTNAGGTTTASDLGLTTPSAAGTLTGASLTKLTVASTVQSLNDGEGVRMAGSPVNDFSITGAGGLVNVSLGGAKTLGDIITRINTAGASKGLTAAISADGHGLTLTDSGGGPVTVAALNGSLAAADLGIAGTGAAGTLTGDRIASALTGPLLKNLRGGYQGQPGEVTPTYGTLSINGQSLDLTGARTLGEALQIINTNTQGVTAALNSAGTGVTLSSSAGSFTVADGTGNLASFLNISGTSVATASGSAINSGDQRLRYISENTRLSTLNGGAGVAAGLIRITGPASAATTSVNIDLTKATTVGDVITKINQSGLSITARINDTGDGILLTQTGGTAPAKIEDLSGGTTAKDLGIAGTFSNNTLDGSFQKSLTIAATDSLSDITTKFNNLGAGVSASVINDGSGSTPFRLSLTSRNSGAAGQLVLDGSAAGLTTTSLLQGQDAVVIYGGDATGKGGLVSTSSSNTLAGVVPGLSVTLAGVGTTSVSVTRDNDKITSAIQDFVDSYNKIVDNIAQVTNFDPNDSTQNGVLFGDDTVQQVENALGSFVSQAYSGVGNYNNLASVGISIGQDGKLTLDSDRLSTALTTNPDAVRALFTTNVKAVTGGPRTIDPTTLLSTLTTTTFPSGHISITDGFGTAHDIDLSSATTFANVISQINAGTAGTVTAAINGTGDGLLLTQVGGSGNASVAEVNGGATATALNIKGVFSANSLNGAFLPVPPTTGVKGLGATLSDLLDRYTNAQTGLLFQSSESIGTLETQLKSRQSDLEALLADKKTRLTTQFANLEVNLAQLQSQGSALTSYAAQAAKSAA